MPLRYALVKEGLEPKAIYSKLYQIPVTLQPSETSVLYSHVEEAMTVPMPSVAEFDDYVIYVGYDPQGALDEQKRRPARPARPPPRAQR